MKSFNLFTAAFILAGAVLIGVAFTTAYSKVEEVNAPAKNPRKGFAVVELFTSEGCSSCPPADQLVELVQQEHPDQPVYVLAYHVDYWDHQGWKDRFSDAAYSKRQARYARWLQLSTVYTPQIVVNGTKELVGSDRPALFHAVSKGLKGGTSYPMRLAARLTGSRIRVAYHTAVSPPKEMELVVALIQKRGKNKVGAGENTGRTLTHVQIVRGLVEETLTADSGHLTLSLPRDYRENQWEVIGFIQEKSNGSILSAAKTELASPAVRP